MDTEARAGSRNGVTPLSSPDREGGSVVGIQRARLLAAMTEVAYERGVADMTVAHVVDRAGVSRRTFYELFDDREECFLAALDEAIACASRYVLQTYDSSARWDVRLRRALTSLLAFLDAERGVGRLLIVVSLGAGARALERRKRVLDRIILEVDAGRELGRSSVDLPSLTAEGVVGAIFSVIHGRMIDTEERPLIELVNPLMSVVVMPYLGPTAARRELQKPVPASVPQPVSMIGDPLRGLAMRITYRTVKVLMALAENPGCSNRKLGEAAGISDQGQTSKLLHRLVNLGLVQNTGVGPRRGERNVWILTSKGHDVQQAVRAQRTS